MTATRVRGLATVLVIVAAATMLLIAVAQRAIGDTGPGWEPDANALGTITFYDANGQVVTGGDLSQHPSAFYAAASAAGRPGDSKAQLKIFTPRVGVLPLLWSGDTLTGATNYPVSTAPVPVKSLTEPVATGTSGDLSLADYIAEFPNDTTDPAYQDLYEIRLATSGVGQPQDAAYFRVDIHVTKLGLDANGEVTGTWDVVFPVGGTPTGSAGTGNPTGTPTPTPAPSTVTATVTATETATQTATVTSTVTRATTPPPAPTPTTPTAIPVGLPTTRAAVPPPATPTVTDTVSEPAPDTEPPSAPPPPDSLGGPLSLASTSTQSIAFAGLWLVLAAAVAGVLWRASR